VLVFDSGVGGLSVMREIAARLPDLDITYAADNAAFPYGVKPEAELVARVTAVIGRLVEATSPDAVVIACNTACTVALDAVRARLRVPVVGVVPAIKPAAASSTSRVIGLLATQTAVASAYTQALIAEFAADCQVLRCGAPELVEIAEQKMRGESLDTGAIRRVVDRLFDQPGGERIDQVVLGCTHFPLLAPELSAAAPRAVVWRDSGAAIARRVGAVLGETEPGAPPAALYAAIFTAETEAVDRMRPALGEFGIDEIGFLPV
jgi:glutamate racemase